MATERKGAHEISKSGLHFPKVQNFPNLLIELVTHENLFSARNLIS